MCSDTIWPVTAWHQNVACHNKMGGETQGGQERSKALNLSGVPDDNFIVWGPKYEWCISLGTAHVVYSYWREY